MKGVKFIIGRPKGQQTTRVQSVLFDENLFTLQKVKSWLKRNGLKIPRKIEKPTTEKGHYLHARQLSPNQFQQSTFRIIQSGNTVKRKQRIVNPHNNYRIVTKDHGTVLYFAGHEMVKKKKSAAIFHDLAQAKRTANKLANNLNSVVYIDTETSRSKNPSNSRGVQKAAKLLEEYSGEAPNYIEEVNLKTPKTGLLIGVLDGVLYTAIRDKEKIPYVHKFKKRSRPKLAVSADGKQLIILGGNYRFTDRGIVDTN